MWEFNVLVTMAQDGHYRQMLEELASYGEFHKTEFHGVALGRVADVQRFLETIHQQRQERVIAFQDISRIVPLDKVFTFDLDDFLAKACQAIRPYLPQMSEHRFYVRLERRGLKGQIVSPDIEQALDNFILDELADLGHSGQIDFESPDAVLAIETVGNRCGIGFITRTLSHRYPFVHVA
ncbi:THUMP domain-containing protein [Syntrophotalea acetylenica]|uniref:THUMP domain-containing protein n=1 Tax=Syntrophotalea acetylenica TaxID=29542 RepID=UPI002A367272|nr:THUMP domain-containing protein [Syntrophotalea acetylenica]MDY0262155.1 THUMP domain-containing protein [Syntrophotalea acetylenica]